MDQITQKDLFDRLARIEAKVDSLNNWKYMVMGASSAIAWVISSVTKAHP